MVSLDQNTFIKNCNSLIANLDDSFYNIQPIPLNEKGSCFSLTLLFISCTNDSELAEFFLFITYINSLDEKGILSLAEQLNNNDSYFRINLSENSSISPKKLLLFIDRAGKIQAEQHNDGYLTTVLHGFKWENSLSFICKNNEKELIKFFEICKLSGNKSINVSCEGHATAIKCKIENEKPYFLAFNSNDTTEPVWVSSYEILARKVLNSYLSFFKDKNSLFTLDILSTEVDTDFDNILSYFNKNIIPSYQKKSIEIDVLIYNIQGLFKHFANKKMSKVDLALALHAEVKEFLEVQNELSVTAIKEFNKLLIKFLKDKPISFKLIEQTEEDNLNKNVIAIPIAIEDAKLRAII